MNANSGLPSSPYPEYQHPFQILAYDDLLEDDEKRDYNAYPPRLLKKKDIIRDCVRGKPVDIQHNNARKVGILHDHHIQGRKLFARGYVNDEGHKWVKDNEIYVDPFDKMKKYRRVGFSVTFDAPKKECHEETDPCWFLGGAFCLDPKRFKCYVKTDYSNDRDDRDATGGGSREKEMGENSGVGGVEMREVKKEMVRYTYGTTAGEYYFQLEQAVSEKKEEITQDRNMTDITPTAPVIVEKVIDPVQNGIKSNPSDNGASKPIDSAIIGGNGGALPNQPPAIATKKDAVAITTTPTPKLDGGAIPNKNAFKSRDEWKIAMFDHIDKAETPEDKRFLLDKLLDTTHKAEEMLFEKHQRDKQEYLTKAERLSKFIVDYSKEEFESDFEKGLRHDKLLKMAEATMKREEEFEAKMKAPETSNSSAQKKTGVTEKNAPTPGTGAQKQNGTDNKTSIPPNNTKMLNNRSDFNNMLKSMMIERTIIPTQTFNSSLYTPPKSYQQEAYSNDRGVDSTSSSSSSATDKKRKVEEVVQSEEVEPGSKNNKEYHRYDFGSDSALRQVIEAEYEIFNTSRTKGCEFHEIWHDIKVQEKFVDNFVSTQKKNDTGRRNTYEDRMDEIY